MNQIELVEIYYRKKDLENKAHGEQIKVRFIMPL